MFFKMFYMVISSLLIFNPIMNLKEMILDGTSDVESKCIVDSAESDGLYNPTIRTLYESTSNVDNTFLNDYYAPTYFKNLRTNFGNNTKGSCGYVATGMLLSFWDTYWDDNVISENYDANALLASNCFDFSADSPGVEMEPDSIANVSDSIYHSNVFTYSNQYFQFLLISMGDSLYGTSAGSYGMVYNNYSDLFDYYVYTYKGYSTTEVHVIKENTNVRNKAINLIKQGIPVKLGIEGHAVVAYDYDETTDSIYCHFGWGENTTHVTIESLGYHSYNNLFAFKFVNRHNHSNNFIYTSSGETNHLCICSSVLPTNITITNNYLDTLPTFKWNSLIKEKWFQSIGLHHEFSILRYNHYEVFTIEDIYDNKVTLNSSNWGNTVNIATPYYYAYVGLASDVDPYWDDYYCLQLFREPNRYLNKSSFLPSNWGLAARYYFSNELDSYHLSIEPERRYTTATINGLTITTDRLRCGYIEQSYVVLSPRRENAGRAYFEMNFDTAVYSFMYRACMWSSSENLDGIAIIQTKNSSGVWTTLKDIPISSLPTKANGVAQFVEQTSQGIYGLRFETTATATGTRNKGRLCLDDIVFSTQTGTLNNSYTNFDYRTKN